MPTQKHGTSASCCVGFLGKTGCLLGSNRGQSEKEGNSRKKGGGSWEKLGKVVLGHTKVISTIQNKRVTGDLMDPSGISETEAREIDPPARFMGCDVRSVVYGLDQSNSQKR